MKLQLQLTAFLVVVTPFCLNTIQAQSSCSGDKILCGSTCFDPTYGSGEICIAGRVECGFGFRLCDTKCTPVGVECDSCGAHREKCGGNCYNPHAGEECTVYTNIICKSGKKACGRVCYNPDLGETCFTQGHNCVVCQAGQELCGRTCFSPLLGDTCNKGNLICRAGRKPCGHNCYNPSLGESCHHGFVVCKSGGHICGYRCYSPAAGEFCTSSYYICTRGQKPCGEFCYNPLTHKCHGTHHCPIGQDICMGNRCYSPALGQKCFPTEGLVCNSGYEPINGIPKCRIPRSKFEIFKQLMEVIG